MTIPKTMTAVLLTGHGGYDKLELHHDVLVPQPQAAVAFGFLIWNAAPMRSSTKLISDPCMYIKETESISTVAPDALVTAIDRVRPYRFANGYGLFAVMTRLRRGKFPASGGTPTGNSETSAP